MSATPPPSPQIAALTPAQHAILAHAHRHSAGKIAWFPDHIKGGARQKVLEGLAKRSLVSSDGTDWVVSPTGYEALGVPYEAMIGNSAISARSAARLPTREGSKQAHILSMLQRPEGATIEQICEATGWQQHTVRGALAGTFKKKLGLTITSSKEAGATRIYRAV